MIYYYLNLDLLVAKQTASGELSLSPIEEPLVDKRYTDYLQFETESNWIEISNAYECILADECYIPKILISDGKWVWDIGIVHYIEDHNLQIPMEFLKHIESNNFKFPSYNDSEWTVIIGKYNIFKKKYLPRDDSRIVFEFH